MADERKKHNLLAVEHEYSKLEIIYAWEGKFGGYIGWKNDKREIMDSI